MRDDDQQESLFGHSQARPERADEPPETDEYEALTPPEAGPGQLTLDPTFDYQSDRKRGRARRSRLGLKAAVSLLDTEQRMAAVAAIGMVVSMFGPWWEQPIKPHLSNSAVSHISFIELAIVLISGSVLLLLYRRAEGREFHLPLSDGTLAAGAGGWCLFLLLFRLFNPPLFVSSSDIEYDPHWGIFVAMAFAGLLMAAGIRGRRKYHAGESEAIAADEDAIPTDMLQGLRD